MDTFTPSKLVWILPYCLWVACGTVDVAYGPCSRCGKGAVCQVFYEYCERTHGLIFVRQCLPLPASCTSPQDVCSWTPQDQQDLSQDAPACARDAWKGALVQNLPDPCIISPDGVVIVGGCD